MIMPDSLRTRSIVFAFLFGPPRVVLREEASQIYSKICDDLEYDDFVFRYNPVKVSPDSETVGFLAAFERREGRGGYAIQIESGAPGQPIRLLCTHTWPKSFEIVKRHFDATSKGVFATLDGGMQRVLAEVRIRAQCTVEGGSGLDFILDGLMRLDREWLTSFGRPISFGGAKLEVQSGQAGGNSLANPKRELSIEPLRGDAKSLYVEFVSQWPQLPDPTGPELRIDPSAVRLIDKDPSEYLQEAFDYMSARINGLVKREDEGE